MRTSQQIKTERRSYQRFVSAHPLAKSLTPKELKFALLLADRHNHIKLYHSRGQIMLSREAMYSPGVRERFIVRDRKCSNE